MLDNFDREGRYGLDFDLYVHLRPSFDSYIFKFYHRPTTMCYALEFSRESIDRCFTHNNARNVLDTIQKSVRIRSLRISDEVIENRKLEVIRTVLQSVYPRR